MQKFGFFSGELHCLSDSSVKDKYNSNYIKDLKSGL